MQFLTAASFPFFIQRFGLRAVWVVCLMVQSATLTGLWVVPTFVDHLLPRRAGAIALVALLGMPYAATAVYVGRGSGATTLWISV